MPSSLLESRANDFNGGLDLNTDRLNPNQISGGKSLRFERGGGIYTGPGFRKTAEVVASQGCDGAVSAERFVAMWSKYGTKVKYSADEGVTWYDSGVTVTDDLLTGFIEQGNGDVFAFNNTDSAIRFSVCDLDTALAASDTTITVGSDQISKFASSGTVYINGTAYTYSGTSGGNLTGVQEGGSAVTTTQTVGTLVVQNTNPSTFNIKPTMAMEVEGRMVVAGVKDFEHIVYYSAPHTLANPEYFYDFQGNGAGSKVMPGKVTGMISGVSGGYIFTQKSVHKVNGFSETQGAMLTTELSSTYGAYNQKCVVDMDGVIAFMGEGRFMPITLTLSPDASASPFLGENFDNPLRPWLETHDGHPDQADAYLKWDSVQKICKIGANVDGALQTYVLDKQLGKFLPTENRSVGASVMHRGKSYFGHRDNGNWYEDDIGRSNDGITIMHKIRSAKLEHDKGRRFLKGKILEYEGWMMQGSEHTLNVYIDGSSDPIKIGDFDDSIIDLSKKRAVGARGVGITTPGDVSGGITVYHFKNRLLIRGLNGEDFTFEWIINGDGDYFQMDTFYFSANVPRRNPRTAN